MADPGIESLETSLRLLRAQQLARRGKLREAMAVVAPGGIPTADPLCLHALAALATGAGDYRTALPLWRTLLEREPGHAEARRMVYASELWLARPPWMKWAWTIVGCVGGAVVAGVLLSLV